MCVWWEILPLSLCSQSISQLKEYTIAQNLREQWKCNHCCEILVAELSSGHNGDFGEGGAWFDRVILSSWHVLSQTPFLVRRKIVVGGTLVSLSLDLSGFPGMERLRNWEVIGVMAKMGYVVIYAWRDVEFPPSVKSRNCSQKTWDITLI